jgi:RNA polymerase sigma factor (sigma-70 family)
MKWQRPPGRENGVALPGAADSFENRILPHLDSAYNLARWLVRDPTLAQDVVQDAVVRALGYFASFRDGDARAWLLRIVRNVAYDALARRRSGQPATMDDALEVADPADDPEATLARRQQVERLDLALAALPIDLRECLVLRELEGLSYKQIAEVAGVPIGTVMSRLARARAALLRGRDEGAAP